MEPGTRHIKSYDDLIWIALFECLGTFIFLFGISFSQGQAYMVAGSLFIAAFMTGRVGGGHYNAGVTLAVYIVEKKWLENLAPMLIIMLADLTGAYAGMYAAVLMESKDNMLVLKPSSAKDTIVGVLLKETFFTMLFITCVLHVKYKKVMSS